MHLTIVGKRMQSPKTNKKHQCLQMTKELLAFKYLIIQDNPHFMMNLRD